MAATLLRVVVCVLSGPLFHGKADIRFMKSPPDFCCSQRTGRVLLPIECSGRRGASAVQRWADRAESSTSNTLKGPSSNRPDSRICQRSKFWAGSEPRSPRTTRPKGLWSIRRPFSALPSKKAACSVLVPTRNRPRDGRRWCNVPWSGSAGEGPLPRERRIIWTERASSDVEAMVRYLGRRDPGASAGCNVLTLQRF
jgi:hypothetical protein